MAAGSVADAQGLELFFLDMGMEKYGDSILCRRGDETILIDGGHKGDLRDRDGFDSIPKQLAGLFGHDPPFPISLLVVTHCHDDHIGCLPELVAQDIIRPEWALVADENLGFGIPIDGDNALDAPDITPAMQRIIAGLREEDHSDLSDDELREFLADAAKLVDRYSEMLEALGDRLGNKLVRFGVDDDAALRQRFTPFGLKILGPTQPHLLICAEEIRRSVADLVDELREVVTDGEFGDATTLDELSAYRVLAREQLSDLADAGRPGFALNDQSIILQIETDDANVLLTGDMQFAEPNIDELIPLMTELRELIAAEPFVFDLVKIAHHGSHNAFDEDVLAELEGTPWFVISGGIKDRGHPDQGVLRLLKRERTRNDIEWVRTDKNGLISVTFAGGVNVAISRGRRNSTSPNVFDAPVAVQPPPPAIVPVVSPPVGPVTTEPAPMTSQSPSDKIRVVTEVPHVNTRVMIAIEVQPGIGRRDSGSRGAEDKDTQPQRIELGGGGRTLPPLLFITSQDALRRNIGAAATNAALDAIRRANQLLIDSLPSGATDPNQVIETVRTNLRDHPELKGVVILGGYDVVPASRLDTIDAALRRAIYQAQGEDSPGDMDDFIVWSDAIYGDKDGDGMGELPVSRIPDGHSADLLLRALQAGKAAPTRRAGIRNLARPYADKVFSGIHFSQHSSALVSEPIEPAAVSAGHLEDAAIYLMLHGNYLTPNYFAGERKNRRSLTAINVTNINQTRLDKAVVLAGCCWGALTVRERAIDVTANTPVTPLRPEESMALSFLNAGALAFVGCTGVHYSPAGTEPKYNGGPLHVDFWKHYAAGLSPAEALFRAKTDYIAGIPHEPDGDAFDRAVELKILREFTCLGLGW